MPLPWQIQVSFAGNGGRKWISTDIRSTRPGWGEQAFSAPIASLEILLEQLSEGSMVLFMSGMEQYAFFIQGLQIVGSQKLIPQSFHFLGKLPGKGQVSMWSVFPGAAPRHDWVQYGAEYFGTAISTWKPGMTGGRIISRMDHAGLEIQRS